jgi:hypothetical protein
MSHATVAIGRCSPRDVHTKVDDLCQLAGMARALDRRAPTILKDDISWHFPFPGANTTPWQLEGTIIALRRAGFSDLVCVQNKTVVTSAFKGEDLNRYGPIFRAHRVPVRYNFLPEDMRWVRYEPRAKLRVLDRIYPQGIHLPDFFFGKNIVHLPTVKCHIYTTTTGAMKNAFGGLLAQHRHYTHSWIHETLVDLLAIQKEIHSGLFAVMDGTTAGNGNGPRTMRPEVRNVMLASADQVAIDAIAAKVMGFDPMQIPYIRMAHEAGLGVGRPEEINVVGDVDIAAESWGFSVGDNFASRIGDALWFGPLKRAQKLFFHTPLVHLFAAGREVYHDYLRWPLHDRRVFEHWRDHTSWGALFQRYEHGALSASTP